MIKRVIWLCSMLLVGVAGLHAQELDLGIQVGARFADYKAVKEYSSSSAMGYNVGAFARLGLFGSLFIQPEAYYTFSKDAVNIGLKEFDVNYNSFDIPVLLGYKILDISLLRLAAVAGPVFSFGVGDNGGLDGSSMDSYTDFKSNYYGFQYGLSLDVGSFMFGLRGAYQGSVSKNFNLSSNQVLAVVGFKFL
ncbi:MAG: outer membrane beta-barrel protein [Bacteroidales bacterium]